MQQPEQSNEPNKNKGMTMGEWLIFAAVMALLLWRLISYCNKH